MFNHDFVVLWSSNVMAYEKIFSAFLLNLYCLVINHAFESLNEFINKSNSKNKGFWRVLMGFYVKIGLLNMVYTVHRKIERVMFCVCNNTKDRPKRNCPRNEKVI